MGLPGPPLLCGGTRPSGRTLSTCTVVTRDEALPGIRTERSSERRFCTDEFCLGSWAAGTTLQPTHPARSRRCAGPIATVSVVQGAAMFQEMK